MENRIVLAKPRLIGGTENKYRNVKIVCQNIRGFPSDRANNHKLEHTRDLLKNTDAAIILETGTNKDNNMIYPEVGLIMRKENKMEDTEKAQY